MNVIYLSCLFFLSATSLSLQMMQEPFIDELDKDLLSLKPSLSFEKMK
jgi:hypothetical protein